MNTSFNEDPESIEGNVICIAVFSSRISAKLAQSVLAGSGIKTLLNSDDYGGLHPALAVTHGVRLLVSSTDAERAKELLSQDDYEGFIDTD